MNIEEISYSHYGKCVKLTNGTVDVLVTADLGPRVIYYGLTSQGNMLAELGPELVTETELGKWHPWGGHRLWAAPEIMPTTYAPDDDPVKVERVGDLSVLATAREESQTRIQKEMLVTVDPDGTRVNIEHRITNKGLWAIELAPWALTIMNGGGTTIFPQEPFIPHGQVLLPARPLVLWNFTDFTDPRWRLGKKYMQLSTDAELEFAQKTGAAVKAGWAAYLREKTLFVKRFPYLSGACYPDFGCNFETYTNGTFMEVETLGPMTRLDRGQSVTHVEQWHLFGNVDAGTSEDAVDAAVLPLVEKTEAI